MSKKKLQPPNFELERWLMEFMAASSDRAAVIVGGAMIDELLGQLPKRYFGPSPSKEDDLLENERPLSSFNARIRIAYRLKLLDLNFAETLHALRGLRNAYAHWTVAGDLDEGQFERAIEDLSARFKDIPLFQSMIKNPSPGINTRSWAVRNIFHIVADLLFDGIKSKEFPLIIKEPKLALISILAREKYLKPKNNDEH